MVDQVVKNIFVICKGHSLLSLYGRDPTMMIFFPKSIEE